ncbi:hypothetical protein BD309DRAFT_383934 [Dichomitus squalens]|uniref:Uncharacterized protein n=1 Tax=Dichomitus squalens TaxID=114155 RepID=A0A4V2K5Z1_9APHY|nr:hypothetical protein BD309DRAFT_383934 [Dichomitus squalens]TBU62933.1 hypothetical protein BD310DRAFT_659140 [Dichomitus squalens]
MPYLERLDTHAKAVATFKRKNQQDSFIALLKDVASVVREAYASGTPDLDAIVTIKRVYSDGDLAIIPSFAHAPGTPPVEYSYSRYGKKAIGFGLEEFADRFEHMFVLSSGEHPPLEPNICPAPFRFIYSKRPSEPHYSPLDEHLPSSLQPQSRSTHLPRFCDGVTVSATDPPPLARTIEQARCEIDADNDISLPIAAAVSSALAIATQGGWKHCEPVLSSYLIDGGHEEKTTR